MSEQMHAHDYEPKVNPDTGRELLPNPERGCGYLEEEKAYIRTEPVRGGDVPIFVTFDPPIPYKEGTLRSYQYLDGLGFQRSLPDDFETTPEDDLFDLWDRLENSEDGSHWGEITTAYAKDLLMWIGETYYETPTEFVSEARRFGLNKAIPVSNRQEPPAINSGKTRVFLIHPAAFRVYEQTTVDPDAEKTDTVSVNEDTPKGEVERMLADYARNEGYSEYEVLGWESDASEAIEYVNVRYFDPDPDEVTENVRVPYMDDDWYGVEGQPDPVDTVPGVVGYSYLSRIVWTAPADNDVPKWANEYDDTGKLDVVDVGEPIPEDEVERRLAEYDGSLTDPEVREKLNVALSEAAETLTPGHGGAVAAGDDGDAADDVGDLDDDEDDSGDSDAADDDAPDSAQAVLERAAATDDVPDDDSTDADVTVGLSGLSLDELTYNELKALAADLDADVSAQPSMDELKGGIRDARENQ